MEKIDEMAAWKATIQCQAGFWKDEIPCGSTFAITEKDLVVESVVVMGECKMNIIGFKCPECGSFTELDGNAVPKVIKNRVLAKYHAERKARKRGAVKRWLAKMFG